MSDYWRNEYQYQIDLAEAGIREQQTEIHVCQRKIEQAERRIEELRAVIEKRKALLGDE